MYRSYAKGINFSLGDIVLVWFGTLSRNLFSAYSYSWQTYNRGLDRDFKLPLLIYNEIVICKFISTHCLHS